MMKLSNDTARREVQFIDGVMVQRYSRCQQAALNPCIHSEF